jgi:hypothetical protein
MLVVRLILLLFAPAFLFAQHSPQGNVDLVSNSACQVQGWARDADNPNPINVKVFANGDVTHGTLIATFIANVLRADLPFPDQVHGFDHVFIGIPAISDGGSHSLYIYAVDATGDPNTLLGSSQGSINCGSLNTNATSFGAKGNGVSGDAPAIQAAIDATAPGGTVLIPAGTYMLLTPQGTPGDNMPAPCDAGVLPFPRPSQLL